MAWRSALLNTIWLSFLSLGLAYAEPKPSSSTEDEIAADLANPLAAITTISGQFRAEFADKTNYQLRLQPSIFKPLSEKSALLVRSILPVRYTQFPSDQVGLGDLALTPYYVPDITTSTFIGYGGAITFPTATERTFGSDQWTAGPAVIFAQIGSPIVYGGLLQYVRSYSGNSNRDDVSVFTAQPFITYLLGGGWSSTLTSETVYDAEGSPGSRWLIPISTGVSKVIGIGGEFFNIGLSAVAYPERPQFSSDFDLRLNLVYVIK